MSKKCGLKKALCPGSALTKTCPFLRRDCTYYKASDTLLVLPNTIIAKMVRGVVQPGQDDRLA